MTVALLFLGQMLDAGFVTVDALDPAAEMLSEAKEKNIYRNLYNCYLTGDPLDIPAGSLPWLPGLLDGTPHHM